MNLNIMLSEELKKRNLSIYNLAKSSGVPYSTVNDLVNRKLPVENLRSGQLKALAKSMDFTMDELFDICDDSLKVISSDGSTEAEVQVKHKTYYLIFDKNGKHYEEAVLPVKSEATKFIETFAKWKLDELLADIEMEEAYEAICSEKA